MGTHRQEDAAPQAGLVGRALDRELAPHLRVPSAVHGPGLAHRSPRRRARCPPAALSAASLAGLKWAPRPTLGCTRVASTMRPLPHGWGAAWQVSVVCMRLCSPNSRARVHTHTHTHRLSNLPPGGAQTLLCAYITPGLGTFQGLGHGAGQRPGWDPPRAQGAKPLSQTGRHRRDTRSLRVALHGPRGCT